MTLDTYNDPGVFSSLAGEWTALLQAAGHHSVFATPEWAQTWWRSFGGESELCLMTLREGSQLTGIVPLFVEKENGRSLARLVGGIDVTDYEDIIAAPGKAEAVWQQAMEHLRRQPWDLDLHNVPGNSPTVAYFRGLATGDGYSVAIEREDVCPVIDPLPADWDSYLESLNKRDRHELRRKHRRLLSDEDVAAELDWHPADLKTAMEDFVRLHKLSSPDKDQFMTARMVAFFNDVATMCQDRGWLCLAFLSVQNVHVSAIMGFNYGDTLYLYNSGYDPAYEYLSSGLLLKALSIEHAIGEGKKCYDFLQGNERYKYDLGGRDTEVYHIACAKKK